MKIPVGQTGERGRLRQPVHPLDPMCESLVTPREEFFVHSRNAAPRIDAGQFRLSVLGEVARPRRFSLGELRNRFPVTTILSTLRCRGDVCGAVRDHVAANAIWGGIPLAELLLAVGVRNSARFALLTGFDWSLIEGRRRYYANAITIEKALRPEVLLAFEMNGEPLPPEHGAPLRLIVPGEDGARAVKWLAEIRLAGFPRTGDRKHRLYNLLD